MVQLLTFPIATRTAYHKQPHHATPKSAHIGATCDCTGTGGATYKMII